MALRHFCDLLTVLLKWLPKVQRLLFLREPAFRLFAVWPNVSGASWKTLIPFSRLRGGVSLAATLDKAVGMKVSFYPAHLKGWA